MLFHICMQHDHERWEPLRPHPDAKRWRSPQSAAPWPAHYIRVDTLEDLLRIVWEVGGIVRIEDHGLGDAVIEVIEDRGDLSIR